MTPKNRTLDGKNRTIEGEGWVKNRKKSLDIIYGWSLRVLSSLQCTSNLILAQENIFHLNACREKSEEYGSG